MEGSTRRYRTAASCLAALVVLASVAAWSATTGSLVERAGARVQEPPKCSPQALEHSLEMDTVVHRLVAKTVKVEKHMFLCDRDGNGQPDTIVDLQLFTEIVERMEHPFPVRKRVQAVRCEKLINNPNPECREIDVKRLREKPQPQPPRGQEPPPPPSDPIEMNTVVSRTGIFKTVKAQKEVFTVPDPDPEGSGRDVLLDVETFTEIFESIDPSTLRNRTGFPVVRWEVVDCIVDYPQGTLSPSEPSLPTVEGCWFSRTMTL